MTASSEISLSPRCLLNSLRGSVIVKSSAVILVLALVIGFAAIHMFRTDAATSSQERTSKTAFYDEYSGPIVNYDVDTQAAAVPDPQTLALRQARSRRYN